VSYQDIASLMLRHFQGLYLTMQRKSFDGLINFSQKNKQTFQASRLKEKAQT
jgi:hypothetical protein